MSLHPRRRRARVQWQSLVWLTAVWVLLWGDLSVGNVLAGLTIAYVVSVVMPLPPIAAQGRVRPLALAHLVGRFAVDVVVASVQVGAQAFRVRPPLSAVIRVRLRSSSDLYLTLTAELCSLVPGSVVVEAHRLTSTLYLHVLDVTGSDGIETARRRVLAQEERVLRALASDAELEAAGLAGPRPPAAPATPSREVVA